MLRVGLATRKNIHVVAFVELNKRGFVTKGRQEPLAVRAIFVQASLVWDSNRAAPARLLCINKSIHRLQPRPQLGLGNNPGLGSP